MNLFPLWNSLRIAAIASIIVFFLGIFLAYFVKKCPRVLKGILDVILVLPLVLPPTVVGYILILIVGPLHPVGQFLQTLGITFFMDWKGGILASVIVSFPLMYRTARSSFEAFDEDLASAGKTLGLSNWFVFWRIRLPNCKNGIIAGAVLAFARALGEYGATSMLVGYNAYTTATISTTVAYSWNNDQGTVALIWTLINIAISAIVLIAVNLFERKGGQKNVIKSEH